MKLQSILLQLMLVLGLTLQAQQEQLSFYETYEWPSSVHESIVWGADDNGLARFVRLTSDQLQVLTGSTELLMGQWFGKAREQGFEGEMQDTVIVRKPDEKADTVIMTKTLTPVNATGFSYVRQLYYDARLHRMVARVSSFGPGMSGVVWKSVYRNQDSKLTERQALVGPESFTWSARVTSKPPTWNLKSIMEQYLEDILISEIENGHLKLQIKMPESGTWGETDFIPSAALEIKNVTEDIYFNQEEFRLYSKIIAVELDSEDGSEFRIQFSE